MFKSLAFWKSNTRRHRRQVSLVSACVQRLEQRQLPAFDLTIGAGALATVGVTETSPGTFEANAAGAFLNVADIQTRLTAGNDVSISSGSNGTQAGNIVWSAGADLDYNGVGARSLTVRSDASSTVGNITINGRILDSEAGADDLVITMSARSALHLSATSSLATVDGGITLQGNFSHDFGFTSVAGLFHGVCVKGSVTSSGSGDIVLQGRAGTAVNRTRNGVLLDRATIVSSGSGDLRIEGLASLLPVRILATRITSSGSGDVAILGDEIAINSTSTINASANVVSLAPKTTGISIVFGDTRETTDKLDVQAGELLRITAGLVRVGSVNDASNDLRIPTWNIDIPRAFVAPAGWNSLSLIGRGLIRETGAGALTVTNLAVMGLNGVHLPSAKNSVSQFAAKARDRNISFVNLPTRSLTVGTVDGLSGISSNGGDIFVRSASGMVVDQAILSGGGTGGVLQVGANVTQNVAPTLGQGHVQLNAGAMPVAGTNQLVFPPVFATRASLIDPQNNYQDNTLVYFDAIANVQFVAIYINNPNPLTTFVLLRYDLGIGYQFDTNGANAFSFALATEQNQFAFSRSAQVVTTQNFGGVLTEQVVENLPDGKKSSFNVVRHPGSNVVTPFNVSTTDGQLLVNFQEYRNFTASSTRLNPEYFTIPTLAPDVNSLPIGTRIGTPPLSIAAKLLAPLPIDIVRVGSPARVVATTATTAVTFDVLLSKDDGRTYPIVLATGLDASNSGPFHFVEGTSGGLGYTFTPTAAMRTNTARIRVVIHLVNGDTVQRDSFEAFRIL